MTFILLHLNSVSWIPNLLVIYKPVITSDQETNGIPKGDMYGIGTAIIYYLNLTFLFYPGLLLTGSTTICGYDIPCGTKFLRTKIFAVTIFAVIK
jgi:hypothetical protein